MRSRSRRMLALLVVPALLTAGWLTWGPGWPGSGGAHGAAEPLIVEVSSPDTARVGDTVGFEAAARDVPDGQGFWFWNLGDGTTRNGAGLTHVTHEFSEAGAYDVHVTVVDAEGRRGVATTRVGASQELVFEGTVSRMELVGTRTYEADFPVRASLAAVHVNATLTRPSPVFAATEPTPPEITLRVTGPGDPGPILLSRRIPVSGDPTIVNMTAPGNRVVDAGEGTLEIVAEEGSTRFRIALTTTHG